MPDGALLSVKVAGWAAVTEMANDSAVPTVPVIEADATTGATLTDVGDPVRSPSKLAEFGVPRPVGVSYPTLATQVLQLPSAPDVMSVKALAYAEGVLAI
jgi:hypothetical protein